MKKYLMLLLVIGVLSIIGCSDSEDNFENMDFNFPLETGNSWSYNLQMTENFDPIVEEEEDVYTEHNFLENVNIVSIDTIMDSVTAYNMQSVRTEGDETFESNVFYNTEGNDLICYGYINTSTATPRKTKNTYNFAGNTFNSPREILDFIHKGLPNPKDDDFIYDPVLTLNFPFELDKSWFSREYLEKTITDQEDISVPAGQFDCWVVEWSSPIEIWEGVEIVDYYSEIGLVKRVTTIYNLEKTDEDGELIGYSNVNDTQSLTEYSVTK